MGRPAAAPQSAPTHPLAAVPGGRFVMLDDEVHYQISAMDHLMPFLVSVPSDTDLWMFITSGGGLTAGRIDPAGSLLPYVTVDRLHDAHHHTGPITLLRVERERKAPILWEPFNSTQDNTPSVQRNLYKNAVGNRIVFEEFRPDLDLAFRYSWSASNKFGWVRTARLENRSAQPAQVSVLDGLRNILPYGAPLGLYQQASNLVDAYKRAEVDPETGIGIFSLTAGITDRAEAIEMLRANTVWCCGLEDYRSHLSLTAVDDFRGGRLIGTSTQARGKRGNYLISTHLDLAAGASSQWHLIGDTGQSQLQITALRHQIQHDDRLAARVLDDLQQTTENLRRNVASADGLQLSRQTERSAHHFTNVLFNNMRGGVFADNYRLPVSDFLDFLQVRNTPVTARHQSQLDRLPETITIQELRELAQTTGEADFIRLTHEYLPLYFGRRHGDPSRPWNAFSIRVRNEAGERALNYEGNWRDVFQNWEALSLAFPGFLPNIVAKFLNASTVDGFNPYRLNRDGVDWEVSAPDDPWSNIGYWGDHQIIYLLKLLETWQGHDPGALMNQLGAEIYSYADVPYRLKPYADLTRDPSHTITFDQDTAAQVAKRVAAIGTDGKLVTDAEGAIQRANLFEKLLVPALSKLSNLVPDGGIWLNTQRPEWNDANNALAGGGLSVVTMGHLRRYLAFLGQLLAESDTESLPVATEVADWFEMIFIALEGATDLLQDKALTAKDRKRLLDSLGHAFSAYRQTVYTRGFTDRTQLPMERAVQLCATALRFIDWGLAANRRPDGLYHTYNMLDVSRDGEVANIVRLPEMLEGQVAILSAGVLAPGAALDLLESLFASPLYSTAQRSFILYPKRELAGFLARNVIPADAVAKVALLHDLQTAGVQTLLARDSDGVYRFHSDLSNGAKLVAALDHLAAQDLWAAGVQRDREAIRALYEEVFEHQSYTGRSSTMYSYEGIGCVYWHMVSKLLLAVQENVFRAEHEDAPQAIRAGLARQYYRVRSGLGYEKSVADYGAFPTDPYSHTPDDGGAKQPGMTGQVKEEILTRRGELGIRAHRGTVSFAPVLLREDEFVQQRCTFSYFDLAGQNQSQDLAAGSLAFTLCQTPVVYELTTGRPWLAVTNSQGTCRQFDGNHLDADTSAELFNRSGLVSLICVGVPRDCLNKIKFAPTANLPESPTSNRI